MSVYIELLKTPQDEHDSDFDAELDKLTEDNELWCWESMLVYHLKLDIEEIQSWDDDKFMGMVARVRWVIEQEQKQWKQRAAV